MLDIDRLMKRVEAMPLARKAWRLYLRLRNRPVGTRVYSIGIYSGDSPLTLSQIDDVRHPVIRAADVSDIEAMFVADPFLLRRGSTWYLFFEVRPTARADPSRNGVIAYATSEDQGRTWEYGQVVLREPVHLSYPCVFEWEGQVYMVPESREAREVRLYRATDFPTTWEQATVLLRGDLTDPSPFYYQGSWYMFAESVTPGSRWKGLRANPVLRFYFADDPAGPWEEHPASPVVSGDARVVRPAGRVISNGPASLLRFAQDKREHYGAAVHAQEITTLTREKYQERPVVPQPLLAGSGEGWNAHGMHHIDAQATESGWIAVVDGWEFRADGR